MIESLRIDGFSGLDDLDVGRLGRITLIVGPGGCGKTNLLEAVFLFCENGNAAGLATALEQRGIPYGAKTVGEATELLSWFASTGRGTRDSAISGVRNGVPRQVTIRRTAPTTKVLISSSQVQDENALIAQASTIFVMETRQESNSWTGFLFATPQGLVSKPAQGAPHIPGRYHGVMAHKGASQALAPLWTEVEDRGESSKVEDLLRLFDPHVEGIRVAAGQSSPAYVRVHHRRMGHIPLEFLGDGFSKALSVACNLVAAAGGVLLIDEFDVSLDIGILPTLASFAITAARRLDVQIFLSTHSLDTVDAFVELTEEADDLHVLRLGRPDAKARLHNIDARKARSLREDVGLDLRRAG